jgi:predicted lipoprotein with Yx(FWY)xxD motif
MDRIGIVPVRGLFGLVLVAGLLLAACGGAATEVPAPTEQATVRPTAVPADGASTQQPSITVSDQQVVDGTVTVDSVTAAEAGWLVIHADADGGPGAVLGHAAVGAGTHQQVAVAIDGSGTTPTLYAMLHVDTGTAGEYDFPDADPPVKVNDKVVVKPFQVEMAAATADGALVATGDTSLGSVLVNSDGRTLYAFTDESDGQIACTGDCLGFWPPLITVGQAQAGEGIDAALLSTVERPDGSLQVAYNGMPLYMFGEDAGPGETNGQGVNAKWFVLSADGALLTAAAQDEPSSGVGSGLY